MCSLIFQLFDGEKVAKAVRGSDAAAKAWLREDFALNTTIFAFIIFTNVTALLLRYVHVTCGKIAARQARGYGVLYKVKPIRRKCYFLHSHAVNRTRFFDQLAYGKMTFTNVSFVFRRCVIISLSKATNSTQFP